DRESMCRTVLIAAKAGKAEIVTSTLTLAEVCKDPASASEAASRFPDFLELEYVLLVTLDRAVGEKARELMQGGYSGLKPLDAIHVATAIVATAHEMHTFDKSLLDMDELLSKTDGSKLKICKSDPGGPLPLFER
ncbi:MAG: type II toxin-antitoxin system VapC family toxin, partial [Methylocella sp.]